MKIIITEKNMKKNQTVKLLPGDYWTANCRTVDYQIRNSGTKPIYFRVVVGRKK